MTEPQNAPESPVQEGDILAGKYCVEKVLGIGGMGVVVRALHVELEERVALKFLLPSAAQNPAVRDRFSREAKAAAKIKSQHVARVSDVGTLENGTPYIVMEYLEGIDLADMLERDKRLPFGAAVDYTLQACEAIAEAHAAGFIHRDLKPANLFLANQADGGAIIKVLDFGISKAVIADEPSTPNANALTRTSDVFGSPMYMSPEQLKSSKDVDVRADVWALGIILYELINGRAPFDRPTVAETFGAILYEKPEPLSKKHPDVPEELDSAILRCLEKDAAARMPNVAELSKALVPFAASVTRASSDRTSRVLRRAGVTINSVPPPSGLLPEPAPKGQTSVPAGAQTRSAWDTTQVQRPRSGTRTALFAALALVLVAGGGAVALKRWPPSSMRPKPAATTQDPPPAPKPTAVAAAPGATPTAVTAAPSATPTAVTAAPSATPTAAPSAKPTVPPIGRGPAHGLRGQPPSVPVETAAPVAPTAAPVAPKPTGDGNDWGADRK